MIEPGEKNAPLIELSNREEKGSPTEELANKDVVSSNNKAPSSSIGGSNDGREQNDESRFNKFVKKCGGGSTSPPPGASIEQSLVTFFGAFVTLLTLSGFYSYIYYVSEGKYKIMLAPFGALVTLQFGLTGVPPAQPRQALYGELIALPISILVNSIPHYILPTWIEIALAPAIGIGVKQYLGLAHPPAGAAAIVFSHLDYGWAHLILFEAGVVIAVLISMVVNNLNEKRQYPTYWNLLPEKTNSCNRSEIVELEEQKSEVV